MDRVRCGGGSCERSLEQIRPLALDAVPTPIRVRRGTDLTKLANDGKLKTGKDYVYSLKNNGMSLGSVSPKVPKAYIAKTNAIAKLIASGKIKVKAEIKF